MRTARRRILAGGAVAITLVALLGCTPAGLLNSVSRLSGDSGVKRAAQGAAYGPLARQRGCRSIAQGLGRTR